MNQSYKIYMQWSVCGDLVELSDAFAASCGVWRLFNDGSTFNVPLPIAESIRELYGLFIVSKTSHPQRLELVVSAKPAPVLARLLEVADYLDCNLATPLASELARRVHGMYPDEIATMFGLEYVPNPRIEDALANWMIPIDHVPTWPRTTRL